MGAVMARDGSPVQVLTDGRVLWVNRPEGLIGRFDTRNGVDVHNAPGSAVVCADCSPVPDWDRFKTSMRQVPGIDLDDQWKPSGKLGMRRMVKVSLLEKHFSPFVSTPEGWKRTKQKVELTREDVLEALGKGKLCSLAFNYQPGTWSSERHAQRVAWLMVNSWTDALEAYTAGMDPGLCEGYHRLAAAIMLGKEAVLVNFGTPCDIVYASQFLCDGEEEEEGRLT